MNITGKFLKVWKVKESNGYIRLDLGDSVKNKDGSYDNWTWFDCSLFGEAAKKTFYEGDTVEITSGIIYQEKYNEKWYTKVKIFHLHAVDQSGDRKDNSPVEEKSPFAESKPEEPKREFGKFTPGGSGKKEFKDHVPF